MASSHCLAPFLNFFMHPINLYNTLTRSAENLTPMDGQRLRFYCCGPTVYGRAHVGNFRTFVMQDVFRRVVESYLATGDPVGKPKRPMPEWVPATDHRSAILGFFSFWRSSIQ